MPRDIRALRLKLWNEGHKCTLENCAECEARKKFIDKKYPLNKTKPKARRGNGKRKSQPPAAG